MESQNNLAQEQAIEKNIPKSKKRVWVIGGVLIILLLLGGVYYYQYKNKQMNNQGGNNVNNGLKTYNDEVNKFSLTHPISWYIGEMKIESNPTLISLGYPSNEKEDDKHASNIIIVKNADYVEKVKENLKEALLQNVNNTSKFLEKGGGKDIKSIEGFYGPLKTSSGFDYYGAVFSFMVENELTYSLQFHLVAGNDLYSFTFITPESEYEINLSIFKDIVDSFKIIN